MKIHNGFGAECTTVDRTRVLLPTVILRRCLIGVRIDVGSRRTTEDLSFLVVSFQDPPTLSPQPFFVALCPTPKQLIALYDPTGGLHRSVLKRRFCPAAAGDVANTSPASTTPWSLVPPILGLFQEGHVLRNFQFVEAGRQRIPITDQYTCRQRARVTERTPSFSR